MPLTPHGNRMLARMQSEYGDKKGKQVMYASMNAGKPGFTGIEPKGGAVQRRLRRAKSG